MRVSSAIRAEAGVRTLSASDLARILGKSPSYVSGRIHDEKEWTLADLGCLAECWEMTPEQLLLKYAAESTHLTSEERKEIMLIKLRRGDLTLAANRDPYKALEAQGGDGR